MPKKLRVGVFMGGPSVEHEVSLDTGKQILENLNKKRYLPIPVKISKEGRWVI